MAYPFLSNRLSFFEPILAVAGTSVKPLCAINLGAANATHGEFVCVQPCIIKQAKASVVLENVVGTTTAPYIVLTKYTAPGAGGTSTVVGSITVPNAATIGKVYYKSNLSTSFAIGDVIQIKHVIGTGGTANGNAHVDWYCEADPENPGNNSDMVVSST